MLSADRDVSLWHRLTERTNLLLEVSRKFVKRIGAPAKLNTKSKEIIDYGRRSNIAPHQEL